MNRDMRVGNHSPNSASNGSRLHTNGTPLSSNYKPLPGTTNGHSAPRNGVSTTYTNGSLQSTAKSRSSAFYGHDREEVTRLLIQGLGDLGYHGAADRLSEESGFEVENASVAAFRYAVLQGEWSEAEALLFGTPPLDEGGGVSISNGDSSHHKGLQLAVNADVSALKFQIRKQKFLELLEEKDLGGAIMVLRQELTPLDQETKKLHTLARFVT